MAYKAPVKEHLFLLNEVLDLQSHSNLPGFADATPDLTSQLLEEAARFCEGVLEPLNAVGDREGCKHDPAASAKPAGAPCRWTPSGAARACPAC